MKRFNFINILLTGAMLVQSSGVLAGARRTVRFNQNGTVSAAPKSQGSTAKEATKNNGQKAESVDGEVKPSILARTLSTIKEKTVLAANSTKEFVKNNWGKLAIGTGTIIAGTAGLLVLKNHFIEEEVVEEGPSITSIGLTGAAIAAIGGAAFWFYKKYQAAKADTANKDAGFGKLSKEAAKGMWTDVKELPGKTLTLTKELPGKTLEWTKAQWAKVTNLFSKNAQTAAPATTTPATKTPAQTAPAQTAPAQTAPAQTAPIAP